MRIYSQLIAPVHTQMLPPYVSLKIKSCAHFTSSTVCVYTYIYFSPQLIFYHLPTTMLRCSCI